MSADENIKNLDDGEDTSSGDFDCNGAGGRKPPEHHEEDREIEWRCESWSWGAAINGERFVRSYCWISLKFTGKTIQKHFHL